MYNFLQYFFLYIFSIVREILLLVLLLLFTKFDFFVVVAVVVETYYTMNKVDKGRSFVRVPLVFVCFLLFFFLYTERNIKKKIVDFFSFEFMFDRKYVHIINTFFHSLIL
jgi:hypothetical protein